MRLEHLYLGVAFIALLLTSSQIYSYYQEHGNDWSVFFREPFSSPAMRFVSFDLLAVAFAAVVFIVVEGLRLKMRRLWIPVALTFMIGISVGFPVFLYMREQQRKRFK